jgi:1-deoxy-D-xylulose-5-phosphate synthase
MLFTATTLAGPSAVRYPRGTGPGVPVQEAMRALPVGRAELRREGHCGLLLLSFGVLLPSVLAVGEQLDATVVNMRFIKPLDEELVLQLSSRHFGVVTIEENAIAGGAGSAVGELLAQENIRLPLLNIGIPDRFIEHGTREDCLASAGLDATSLQATIKHWWSLQPAARALSADSA